MSADYHQPISKVLPIRTRSSALLAPEEVGSEVHNWRLLEDGTLRTVKPPIELVPRYQSHPSGWLQVQDYGDPLKMLGLFHARLEDRSSREVFLAHFGGALWLFQGYKSHISQAPWVQLIGPDASAQIQTELQVSGLRPSRHTQFVATPSGVVILIEGLRPYIFDGELVRPFGFMEIPSPPKPLHPQGSVGDGTTTSSTGVAGSSSASNEEGFSYTGRTLPGALGTGRYGTIDTTVTAAELSGTKHKNPLGGAMLQTEHQFRTQWVDHFGNLSAISDASASASCAAEQNLEKDNVGDQDERADRMRWEIQLTSIGVGPEGTAGRIVGMTRDLKSSGDPAFYNVVTNLGGANFGFSTIPDNDTEVMPFNISSDWLQVEMLPVLPMPLLSFGALAMGRFWGASKGRLVGSYMGRYGTLDPNMSITPDARGAEITALVPIAEGLLVFTSRSVYIIEPNDDGSGVRARTLHPDVGTRAPGSVQAHPSGPVFWRSSARTFHQYSGGEVTPVMLQDISDILSTTNRAWESRSTSAIDPISGAYRCWIALQGSSLNNICIEFDGNGWRTRDDIKAQAACTMDSPEKLVAALGQVATVDESGVAASPANSVYAIDHAGLWTREYTLPGGEHNKAEAPAPITATLATTWLRTSRSYRKGSPTRILLWLHETSSGKYTIEAMRDNREVPLAQNLLASDSRALSCAAEDDKPAFYGTVILGSEVEYPHLKDSRGRVLKDAARMRTRRRYSAKVDLELPSVETFKVRLRVTGDANFAALAYQENTIPWHGGATLNTGEGSEP